MLVVGEIMWMLISLSDRSWHVDADPHEVQIPGEFVVHLPSGYVNSLLLKPWPLKVHEFSHEKL